MIHVYVRDMKQRNSALVNILWDNTPKRACLFERSFGKTMVQAMNILLFVVITLSSSYTGHNTWSRVNLSSQFNSSFFLLSFFFSFCLLPNWKFIASSAWDQIRKFRDFTWQVRMTNFSFISRLTLVTLMARVNIQLGYLSANLCCFNHFFCFQSFVLRNCENNKKLFLLFFYKNLKTKHLIETM